ncbi:unnamed protein product [Trichogramma brassicae]|uniref:Uncharacterized protein n=1 Tax=Trichogramma brassicae TaxID=86971 RepID=A0A6H5IQF2_9HYME|nr:unnamed protein product [Trichogramma brassicae]
MLYPCVLYRSICTSAALASASEAVTGMAHGGSIHNRAQAERRKTRTKGPTAELKYVCCPSNNPGRRDELYIAVYTIVPSPPPPLLQNSHANKPILISSYKCVQAALVTLYSRSISLNEFHLIFDLLFVHQNSEFHVLTYLTEHACKLGTISRGGSYSSCSSCAPTRASRRRRWRHRLKVAELKGALIVKEAFAVEREKERHASTCTYTLIRGKKLVSILSEARKRTRASISNRISRESVYLPANQRSIRRLSHSRLAVAAVASAGRAFQRLGVVAKSQYTIHVATRGLPAPSLMRNVKLEPDVQVDAQEDDERVTYDIFNSELTAKPKGVEYPKRALVKTLSMNKSLWSLREPPPSECNTRRLIQTRCDFDQPDSYIILTTDSTQAEYGEDDFISSVLIDRRRGVPLAKVSKLYIGRSERSRALERATETKRLKKTAQMLRERRRPIRQRQRRRARYQHHYY